MIARLLGILWNLAPSADKYVKWRETYAKKLCTHVRQQHIWRLAKQCAGAYGDCAKQWETWLYSRTQPKIHGTRGVSNSRLGDSIILPVGGGGLGRVDPTLTWQRKRIVEFRCV